MEFDRIVFSGHALQRMFKRRISREDVAAVLRSGEVIAEYSEDDPYPSSLILGFPRTQPVHVVAAWNESEKACIIITAYDPSPLLWEPGFRRRRSR